MNIFMTFASGAALIACLISLFTKQYFDPVTGTVIVLLLTLGLFFDYLGRCVTASKEK